MNISHEIEVAKSHAARILFSKSIANNLPKDSSPIFKAVIKELNSS